MTLLQRAKKSKGKFLNPVPTQVAGLATVFKILPRYVLNRKQRFPIKALGPFSTNPNIFAQPPSSGLRVTWFGHSSMLLEIDGARVLIDPIWEERASPIRWSGPKRFFSPTIPLHDLPDLDVVLISHDHYDHLGETTVRSLVAQRNASAVLWLTSRGVGSILTRWGVARSRIVELDWTETHVNTSRGANVKFTSWPARHFSGRSLLNRFQTLWASFVIESDRHSVYYGADSGPWPGFTEIGEKRRSFDLTMLEIGASDPLWADIHLGAEGAASAFKALDAGGLLMPIHWGLFDLALHGWTEPIEHLRRLGREQGIALWSPEPGWPTEVLSGKEVFSEWWMDSTSQSV